MDIIAMFLPGIMMIALGIAIGMYIASQIENHIDKRIKK